MNPESETGAALKRAGVRVAFHLMRAGVEALKAVEAVIDELGKVGSAGGEDRRAGDGPERIVVE
ncbi:MAG TPA: hypothetical protein VLB67_12430 [Acidimicrobiia bacterium]|nr:hypothetical protein [Acidimicrobiia bacterium]